MRNFFRIGFYIYLIWAICVVYFNLTGHVGFGHGLGDLYYLITLAFLTAIAVIFFFRITKGREVNITIIYIYLCYLLAILIAFSLKLTLFRGAEFPWNGEIFI